MVIRFNVVMLVLALTTLSGCTTCDNPYDYTGPVVDAGFHPAGFRAGGGGAMPIVAPELIPAPPPPPLEQDRMESNDTPPSMGDMETNSVMRPRLRYAR